MKINSLIDTNNSNRVSYLDGLRGIAILLVILYHAYSDTWDAFLPYHYDYHDFFIFKYGHYGVQLFFLISGFVISMTLEKCNSFGDFMFRRWLRLFPAMLIVSLIILITAPLLPARPMGMPNFGDLIPGLAFVEPEVFRIIFNNQQHIIEGSFWTLFVEVKFYIVAGLLYFSVGRKKMIMILISMFLIYTIFDSIKLHIPDDIQVRSAAILRFLNYQYYGWFAAGALFFEYYSLKNKWYFMVGLLVSLLAARGLDGFLSISMIFATTLVFIFAFAIFNPTLQQLLSNRFLVFIGYISYPLYLIHENAMISMIIQLHKQHDWIPVFFLPILPILGVVFVAWIIAHYLEPVARQFIKNVLLQLRANTVKVIGY